MRSRPTIVALVILAFAARAEAAYVDDSSHQITAKLVYCGPATALLHQNLEYINSRTSRSPTPPKSDGKLLNLPADEGRTLLYDFLPLSLGEIRGYTVAFHLYTVPAEAPPAARTLLLKGADGVVFVADSDASRVKETLAAWNGLKSSLEQLGYDFHKMPLVVQLDHRNHPNAIGAEALRKLLGLDQQPTIEAISSKGVGVFDTLKSISKLVLHELKNQK
jgi:hypothetical protein